jgi:hypothetical protein
MRELPLLDPQGNPFPPAATFLILRAIMLSPKDIGSARTYMAVAMSGDPDSNEFSRINAKFLKRAPIGAIAGEVFLTLLGLKVHRPKDASANKAAFLVSRGLEGKRRRSRHVDRVRRYWDEFRPVAHMWAALVRLQGDEDLPPEFVVRAARQWDAFKHTQLEISDAGFAELNEHVLLDGDRLLAMAAENRLTIDPAPWTLPPRYPRKPRNIDVPAPSPWVEKTLKEYRAPKPQK